jgi:Spy/CpxP family protein refolding chaperone
LFRLSLAVLAGSHDSGRLLLELGQVQEELKLTEQQKVQLAELSKEYRARIRIDRSGAESLRLRERLARWAEMRKTRAAAAEEYRKKVDEILLPEQRDRLRQIELQLQGPQVLADTEIGLADTEIVVELGLTEEQRERLRAIRRESLEEMRSLWSSRFRIRDRREEESQRSDAEIEAEVERLRQEAIDQALGILTPEQRDKFDKMKGAKFELSPSS